jgi:hypothetical protein
MRSTSNITFRFNWFLVIILILAQIDSYTLRNTSTPVSTRAYDSLHGSLFVNESSLFQGLTMTQIVFPPSQSLRLDLLNIRPSLWPCKKTNTSKIFWPWGVDHYQHFHPFDQLYGYNFSPVK